MSHPVRTFATLVALGITLTTMPLGYLWLTMETPEAFERNMGGAAACVTGDQIRHALDAAPASRERAQRLTDANDCMSWGPTDDLAAFYTASREVLTHALSMVEAGSPEQGVEMALDVWELSEDQGRGAGTLMQLAMAGAIGEQASEIVHQGLLSSEISQAATADASERMSVLMTSRVTPIDVARGEETAVMDGLGELLSAVGVRDTAGAVFETFALTRGHLYPYADVLQHAEILEQWDFGHGFPQLHARTMLDRMHVRSKAAVLVAGSRAQAWAASHGACPEGLDALGVDTFEGETSLSLDTESCTIHAQTPARGMHTYQVTI